jgi:exopolysaccharide biosynthesis polyprenyl glycosylphosphotransferase
VSEPAAILSGPEVAGSALPLTDRTRRILEKRQRTARVKRRGWLIHRFLLLADVIGLTAAFLIAEFAFGRAAGAGNHLRPSGELLFFVATLPAWIVVAKLYELYDHDEERADHTTIDDLTGVFHLVTTGTWLLVVGAWITGFADPNLPKLITFWGVAIVLVTAARGVARFASSRSLAYIQNAVVVGAGHAGQLVARKLVQHPEYGVNVVGFVDGSPRERREDLDDVPLLGAPDELPKIIELLDVERVVVAFSNESHEETLRLIGMLKRMDLQIDIVPRLYEVVGPNVNVHTVESMPLIGLPAAKLFPFSSALKRAVDIVGAAIGLILTAPLLGFVAWRIKRDSPGPVFFRQMRLGYEMREFTVLKFRTMYVDVDQDEHRRFIERTMSADATPEANGLYKLERDDAITPVGRWLRKTSLDELPQLINVLRGDMSLVGPRPCLPYETDLFQLQHFERFNVPAGITGLWQVTARAHSTFGEALDMDVAYARNWSLGLDLSLLLRTPLHILRGKGTA